MEAVITNMEKKSWLKYQINKALFLPIKSLKKRYVPLLLIYFAYGLSGFSAIALSFWEKDNLGLSAEELISISVWIMVPWTLKMVFGQMVDSVKVFGSRRKVYIFIGAIFLIIGALLLAGLAGRHDWVMWIGGEYRIYLLSMLFTTFGFVVQDVTADTMSTEVVARKDDNGLARPDKDVQSELAMAQLLGRLAFAISGFAVAGLGGWLAANFEYEYIFWATLVIPLISCVGVLFVKLEKIEEHERKPLDLKIIIGGIVFAVFSVMMAVKEVGYGQEIVFGVSLILLLTMMYWVTREVPSKKLKMLACAMAALFIYRATALVGVGPGLRWWAIDMLGFDPAFFGVLAQIGAATALIVLWFFSDLIANRPVRSVLIFLVIFGTIMSLPELVMYYDLHELVGIKARTIALFDTALENPLVHISMVPMLALIAFYAPAGRRGTWFAVSASLMNLAITGGNLITKYLNKIFVVSREVIDETGTVIVAANYSELGILMIVKILIALVFPLLAVWIFLRRDNEEIGAREVISGTDMTEEAPIPQRRRTLPDV